MSIRKKDNLIIEKKDVTKFETQLKNNVYKQHTAESVVQHQNAEHLNKEQKNKLQDLLSKFTTIMEGTIGYYKKHGGRISGGRR